jgi:5-methylcytosine-specific restriction endonuclease McrA
MPIKKEKMKLYPGGSIHSKEWKAIRSDILKRAEHKCERCMVPNHKRVLRPDLHNTYIMVDTGMTFDADTGELLQYTRGSEMPYGRFVDIVLTTAHIDQDPKNNDPSNLLALCQQCHNRLDAPFRKVNAANTRHGKKAIRDLFHPRGEK